MTTPFLWTNDDIACGHVPQMQRQLEFLARWDIKGSFCVVPCLGGKPLTRDRAIIELLQEAEAAGHELVHHSTTHHCEENGLMDIRMLDYMSPKEKWSYAHDRFPLESIWSFEAIRDQIRWGLDVWLEAFGKQSTGYRPGCGSFCGAMYHALEELGFKWCSGRMASFTGWQWSAGRLDYPEEVDGPVRPYWIGKILEIPIYDDFAFRVPVDKLQDFIGLAKRSWDRCVENGWPLVLCSHYHGLEHSEGTGYQVHEALLDYILGSGQAEPMTLTQFYHDAATGRFPLASAEETPPPPDQIPCWHVWARKSSR
jgi:hypothetical protein